MLTPRTRIALMTGALAAVLLAACGANGEGAPKEAGCPVGQATSSCTSTSSGAAASPSATTPPNPCTTAPTPSPTPGGDDFCTFVAISTEANGLQTGDIKVGSGAEAKPGSKISVQYTGWLQATGVLFDTSRQSGRGPFALTLGQNSVIPGWEQGIPGMKVGGKRRLVIPAPLGYGATGSPPTIPPNAVLVFDIELLSVT